ncbi:hypothetical protein NMG60_11008288 [Bertholletia excelsa]
MQVWLKQLKLAASKAEDVLDELAYEDLRRKIEVQDQLTDKVRDFCLSNPTVFRYKMARKITKINSSLDSILKDAKGIGLKPAEQHRATNESIEFKTLPFPENSPVAGRELDLSTVKRMLLKPDVENNLSVIAIVGMAGLGKTTLARLIYNDEKFVKTFDSKMWICVSVNFKIERILNDMVESLTGQKSEATNVEGIVRKLQEELSEKKYLLILDDVWSQEQDIWDPMRRSLLAIGGLKGCKILVTTRSSQVVSTMKIPPSLTHNLKKLSEEDSWEMFSNKVFACGGPRMNKEVVDIGKVMVKRCKGLPLAIKTLGGLMYFKHYEDEWASIRDSEIWSLPETQNDILPSLRLSYDQLPHPSLKQCFAYCAVFQKDYRIQKDMLVQLWMAQGYLQPPPRSNLEMVDVGNQYFNILLRSSLFEDVETDEFNNIISCMMHDLVHDLALRVSEGNCLSLHVNEGQQQIEGQHLLLYSNQWTSSEIQREKAKRLRTLLLEYCYVPEKNLVDLKSVRAFKGDYLEQLPTSIGKCIHLRYLDLSDSRIQSLPNSVTKLYNLETLNLLRCWRLRSLPKELYKLSRLKHLCIDQYTECDVLRPFLVGKLTSLQTLPYFDVGEDEGYKIEELGSLNNLRGKLSIHSLHCVKRKDEAEKANLYRKSKIQELEFHWGSRQEEFAKEENEDVLEGLRPPRTIGALMIQNFNGGKFASWMINDRIWLRNLVKISLINCKNCEQIPALGRLPGLRAIELKSLTNVRHVDVEFYGETIDTDNSDGIKLLGCGGNKKVALHTDAFPALKELSLVGMRRLEDWSDPTLALDWTKVRLLPCLEKLTIDNCPELNNAPIDSPSFRRFYQSRINSMEIGKDGNKGTFLEFSAIWALNLFLNKLLENNEKSLKELIVRRVQLHYFWSHLPNLSSLENLYIEHCPNIKSITIQNIEVTAEACSDSFTSLRKISIRSCKKLTCLPKALLHKSEFLESLEISNCPKLVIPNDAIIKLKHCLRLRIVVCGELQNFWQEGLVFLTELQHLLVGKFSEELEYFPWPASSNSFTTSAAEEGDKLYTQHHHYQNPFPSLKFLRLYGWPKLKFLPDQIQYLTSLQRLCIAYFDGLETLPEWLGNLTSLSHLEILSCENLVNLPSQEAMHCLSNLTSLMIVYCPLLQERCTKGSGPEWPKISHIPFVHIRTGPKDEYAIHLILKEFEDGVE